MTTTDFSLDGRRITILDASHGEAAPLIYMHFAVDEAEAVLKSLDMPLIIAAVEVDWNHDLTPWPAPKVMPKGKAFTGGADAYLHTLCTRIVPEVESRLPAPPLRRGIAGYSLAGLFAVYALYKADLFDIAASLSGSLWFDGFEDYQQTHTPLRVPEKLYFSLGDREAQTKYERMARVEVCTAATKARFDALGAHTTFRRESGGHFQDIPGRIVRGLSWLAGD
ncbi:MAG: alpha/beta hydrolase [Ruminococcaceae bacterium]|nr:alpha/beta hydrolase [Oscillospiraceae bacterium]